ncbi:MAG: hypothetical protein AB7V45_12825 [Candidatus Krumholzibacteriia bacterium]
MTDYHENGEALPDDVKDVHRALVSLKEEIERACMSLEWLRRKLPAWNDELGTFLFTDTEITAVEEGAATARTPPGVPARAEWHGRRAGRDAPPRGDSDLAGCDAYRMEALDRGAVRCGSG